MRGNVIRGSFGVPSPRGSGANGLGKFMIVQEIETSGGSFVPALIPIPSATPPTSQVFAPTPSTLDVKAGPAARTAPMTGSNAPTTTVGAPVVSSTNPFTNQILPPDSAYASSAGNALIEPGGYPMGGAAPAEESKGGFGWILAALAAASLLA